jgi:hypothetical protein
VWHPALLVWRDNVLTIRTEAADGLLHRRTARSRGSTEYFLIFATATLALLSRRLVENKPGSESTRNRIPQSSIGDSAPDGDLLQLFVNCASARRTAGPRHTQGTPGFAMALCETVKLTV